MRNLIGIIILLLSVSGQAKTLYGSHLTGGTNWVNRISVFNNGETIVDDVIVKIYNEEGTLISNEIYSVDPFSSRILVLTGFTEFVQTEYEDLLSINPHGTFTVETESEKIAVKLSFQFEDRESISEFFLNGTLAFEYLLPNTVVDHFDWLGMVVFNTYNAPIDVTFVAYKDGLVVGDSTIVIDPLTKWVGLSTHMWDGLEYSNLDQIRIVSDYLIPTPFTISGNNEQDRHLFFNGVATKTFQGFYTITASAGSNGSISPSGSIDVAEEENQSFSITANSGYSILDVVVDGRSIGVVSSYTFDNVTANHTIYATFKTYVPDQYTITVNSGPGGSTDKDGDNTVNAGDDLTITALPNQYNQFISWSGSASGNINPLVLTNIAANATITANFVNPPPVGTIISPANNANDALVNVAVDIIVSGTDPLGEGIGSMSVEATSTSESFTLNASSGTCSFVPTHAEFYTITLTVTDDSGHSDVSSILIHVNPVPNNTPPVISNLTATPNPCFSYDTTTVSFDISDADGDNVDYTVTISSSNGSTWHINGTTSTSGTVNGGSGNVSLQLDTGGSENIVVTVDSNDNNGGTDSEGIPIDVQ